MATAVKKGNSKVDSQGRTRWTEAAAWRGRNADLRRAGVATNRRRGMGNPAQNPDRILTIPRRRHDIQPLGLSHSGVTGDAVGCFEAAAESGFENNVECYCRNRAAAAPRRGRSIGRRNAEMSSLLTANRSRVAFSPVDSLKEALYIDRRGKIFPGAPELRTRKVPPTRGRRSLRGRSLEMFLVRKEALPAQGLDAASFWE